MGLFTTITLCVLSEQYSQNSWQFLPNFSSVQNPPPILVTGLRVCPFAMTATATTTLAMTNNTSYWMPFAVNRNINISAISINVSTAAASTSETVGIYNSNLTNLYPNTLLGSVTLDTTTTGLKTGTLSTAITLTPGMYWIALASNGAPTLTALAVEHASTFSLFNHNSGNSLQKYRNNAT
jgi:hypothetical protein